MILQIRFQNFEKPENQEYIAGIVEKYRALLPTWLRTLTVSITDTLPESGSLLWAIGRPEYGTANIVIVSRWLDRDPELQHLDLLHEILHVAHRREYSFVESQLLDTIEDQDKKLHAYLVEDYRVRNEEFIEGIAQGIRALLGETEKEKAMHKQEICCRCCGGCLTAFEHEATSTCAKCGRGPYCSRCGGNHAENCQKPFAEESWNCAGCDKSFLRSHADTGWRCPDCFKRPLCGNCAEKHLRRCQKINGFVCKLCGQNFVDLADYTMHATTCVRPETEDAPEVEPHRAPAQCFGCGSTLVAEEDGGWTCLKCSPPKSPKDGGVRGDLMPDSAWLAETPEARNQACHEDLNRRVEELEVRVEPDAAVQSIHARSISALEKKAEEPKPGGNYGAPDIDKWFKLRVPTEQEAKDMDTLRATYTKLALDLEILCPEGADRMAALRLLKQSMHTAIGSIVTMDAWQTPKGD